MPRTLLQAVAMILTSPFWLLGMLVAFLWLSVRTGWGMGADLLRWMVRE